ncbi:hypothetical protein [Escherichia coli]|uniref:hypothetical protein n=1 Tax=Escherichia coli TaxID=562 RepID=UPI003CC82387
MLGDEAGKESLSQRIQMIYKKGLITEQMKEWAHIVRIDAYETTITQSAWRRLFWPVL